MPKLLYLFSAVFSRSDKDRIRIETVTGTNEAHSEAESRGHALPWATEMIQQQHGPGFQVVCVGAHAITQDELERGVHLYAQAVQ